MLVDLACGARAGPWELADSEVVALYERMRDASDRGLQGIEPDEEGFFRAKYG
ncbi:hypothetical protein GCM10027191_15240 [Novilysobacter erysipheiresistens]